MVEVMQRCWPERFNSSAWQDQLRVLIPSWGEDLAADTARLSALRSRTDAALGLTAG